MVESLEKIADVEELQKFTDAFSARYNGEKSFREIVHRYFKLGKKDVLKLSFESFLFPSWYKANTDKMIHDYAIEIRDKAIKARALKLEIERLRKEEEDLIKKRKEKREAEEKYREAQNGYNQITRQKEQEKTQAQLELEEKIRSEEEKNRQEQYKITRDTDAEEIAKRKLAEFTKRSKLVRVRDDGSFSFNEDALMKRLGDIVLEEIIKGIEKEDGRTGFMGRAKQAYEGIVSHYDRMESVSEIKRVNWAKSIKFARSRMQRVPRYPYYIVGKFEGKIRCSLDTAVIYDRSGSMDENGRIDAARKTTLAMNALMKKLNDKNETYLGCFNSEVSDITPKQVMEIKPYNGTATELALDWIRNKLSQSGLSIGYLITDGEPNHIDLAIKAAAEFRKHPEIMLRLFLIDGNENSRKIIRDIGRAAGPDTKVVCIDNYKLAGGVIRDLASSLGQMQYASRL